jgi:hypothetical protein
MLKQVNTVREIKEILATFPDDYILIGSTVDDYENWFTYPVFIGNHPGEKHQVLIQLKPLSGSNYLKSE